MSLKKIRKDEYRFVYHKGQKIVLCERLDMLGWMEEELLQGTLFAYKCPSEKESALKWKKAFEDFTKRSFTVASSYMRKGIQTVFVGRLCCVHRSVYRSRRKTQCSKLDFGCRALLKLFVRVPESKRSKNPTRGGYNLRVCSNKEPHNHSLEQALKFRRLGDSTRAMLMELFDQHYTPATAMEALKLRLLAQLGDDYMAEASDRAVLPDKGAVTRLFYETYRDRYGTMKRKEVRKLQEEAARKRLWLQSPRCVELRTPALDSGGGTPALGSSGGTPAADTSATVVLQQRPDDEQQSENDDGGDDFMDSFDDPGELPAVSWMGTQISFGEPAVSVEAGPSQSGADVVAAAVASVVNTPAQQPPDVIVCYTDGGVTDAASALLVESTGNVSLDAAEKPMDAVGDMLVDTVGVEEDVATEAVIEGVSEVVPGGLLTSVSDIGSSPALGMRLPFPTEPVGPKVPSAEMLSREIATWASEMTRRLAVDDSDGLWRSATAAFLENWELLPAPGQMKALSQFGHVTGLGRPVSAAKPQTPGTAKPTETAATQTEPEDPPLKQRSESELRDGGSEADADPKTPSPYFRSLCVLRNDSIVSSIPLRRESRIASLIERRKQMSLSRHGARD